MNENSNNSNNRPSNTSFYTVGVCNWQFGWIFIAQLQIYIGSDGLQITATRLPQNAPNRMWNSKNFPGYPRTPTPAWESAKVATLLKADNAPHR